MHLTSVKAPVSGRYGRQRLDAAELARLSSLMPPPSGLACFPLLLWAAPLPNHSIIHRLHPNQELGTTGTQCDLRLRLESHQKSHRHALMLVAISFG